MISNMSPTSREWTYCFSLSGSGWSSHNEVVVPQILSFRETRIQPFVFKPRMLRRASYSFAHETSPSKNTCHPKSQEPLFPVSQSPLPYSFALIGFSSIGFSSSSPSPPPPSSTATQTTTAISSGFPPSNASSGYLALTSFANGLFLL